MIKHRLAGSGRLSRAGWVLVLAASAARAGGSLENQHLRVALTADNGTYSIAAKAARDPLLQASVAAQVDHRWLRSSDYPRRQALQSAFKDVLGSGEELTVTCSGLAAQPDLIFTIRLYDSRPYGELQLRLVNRSDRPHTVQRLRSLQAVGPAILNLGAPASADRILSDSFSEDWPPLRIFDLGKAPRRMHRAVGSQLIYNRRSRQSAFFGALTSDRLLTILHLQATDSNVQGFNIDSTGTTEIQATEPESDVRHGPKDNLVELNLALPAAGAVAAERVMFSVGDDYHAQLETYGAAIRELHHSRIPDGNMLGWWSWTAYYTKITESAALANAQWLSRELLPLGYDYFHFDLGYGYARGDYTRPNLPQFPHGMAPLTHQIAQMGLRVGVWTAPFEVSERSSIYLQHPDWLVRNSKGRPIQITTAEERPGERVYVLDTTHPGAQRYLRDTYTTMVREWGVKYIKLDFMDNTAIEGKYYRPDTTALEAQRLGLQIIRDAVGDEVLLDKDGSPMLNPVGLVNDGRISQDTGHTFERSREAAPAIAARYYMHRNFFINDPDAFTVSKQVIEERTIKAPLTLDEAEVSIVLSAVTGGLFEIGDDLPTVGKDPERVALLKNPELLRMVKLGLASRPLDLMSYEPADEIPSLFLLRESEGEYILAVFNWTAKARSRQFAFADLGLPPSQSYSLADVLRPGRQVTAHAEALTLDLAPRSVRLIKIARANARH